MDNGKKTNFSKPYQPKELVEIYNPYVEPETGVLYLDRIPEGEIAEALSKI